MNYGELMGYWTDGHGPTPRAPARRLFEYSETEIKTHAATYIPEGQIESMMAYVMDGTPPDGFMIAVLQNDLMGAAAAADPLNVTKLRDWVIFLHNFTPGGCHGSVENHKEWIEHGGLKGLEKGLQSQAKAASAHYEKRDEEESNAIRKRRDRPDEHPEE